VGNVSRDVKRLIAISAVAGLALLASGAASPLPVQAAGCPRAALPISGTNPIAAATNAALRRVPVRDRPQVRGAQLAIADISRGPRVKTQCGQRIAARTIVVYILRRAYLPAQSAAQGVYFVSRFDRGYRVWQVAH
jgi:hypothetical protein